MSKARTAREEEGPHLGLPETLELVPESQGLIALSLAELELELSVDQRV